MKITKPNRKQKDRDKITHAARKPLLLEYSPEKKSRNIKLGYYGKAIVKINLGYKKSRQKSKKMCYNA